MISTFHLSEEDCVISSLRSEIGLFCSFLRKNRTQVFWLKLNVSKSFGRFLKQREDMFYPDIYRWNFSSLLSVCKLKRVQHYFWLCLISVFSKHPYILCTAPVVHLCAGLVPALPFHQVLVVSWEVKGITSAGAVAVMPHSECMQNVLHQQQQTNLAPPKPARTRLDLLTTSQSICYSTYLLLDSFSNLMGRSWRIDLSMASGAAVCIGFFCHIGGGKRSMQGLKKEQLAVMDLLSPAVLLISRPAPPWRLSFNW